MPNEYDNDVFFAQYAQMDRSKGGLAAAGEWHQLQPLFPPLEGMAVLDLGCGYGWHCKYAADHGTTQVLSININEKMLEKAVPEYAWDIVVSNLALHYIEDLEQVFRNVWRTLKPGGTFLFNIEHPVFTAGVHQDWIYNEDGRPKYWPVDDYYRPGQRMTRFLGCDVIKQHHTLTQILMGLLNCGFALEVVEEVQPSKEMLEIPGMAEELRRPMMLLVRAKKHAAK